MKPISRLFRKSPSPAPAAARSLDERIAALSSASAESLHAIAAGDDDARLRTAAIRLLPDGDELRRLAGLVDAVTGDAAGVPTSIRQAALERLSQLIDDGTLDFDRVCGGSDVRPQALVVAALCRDPERLQQLLGRIDEPAELARLAAESPSSRVRQAAAAAVDDPALLHALLSKVRGRDKTVFRIVRQKCDALLAERRQAEESARESLAIASSLEQHAARRHDPLYAATVEVLSARWRELPVDADPEVAQRVRQALERCRDVIRQHEHELAQQAAARIAEQAAREARARDLEAERVAAEERAAADARSLAEAAEAEQTKAQDVAGQRTADAQAYRQIGGLIRLGRAALENGNTRKAARFRQAIEDAMQSAPPLTPAHARKLHALDERLNELREWKHYVVAPKRIELIEEMEALIGASEEPEALAEHIRALQQEWRTTNKGIVDDTTDDGARFQRAFQAAFKPCQAYFAAQAAIRRQNLEARMAILERLAAFEATQQGDNPDRRLLFQVLREAPREWRSHFPVDRDAGRSAEAEFRRSMHRLQKLVDGWHAENEAQKLALIAQARQLGDGEDVGGAIDGVKRLQSLWKETGPASRERSEVLWDEFRGLCDAVFRRREHVAAEHAASLGAARGRVAVLCDAIEEACLRPPAEAAEAHARLREWRADFDAAGELPRGDARNLRDRFERAVARFEATLADRDLRDMAAAESNLLEAGRRILAYERTVMRDAPGEERESLRNAAEAFIAGVRRWPRGGAQLLKLALARADAAATGDDGAPTRELALRELCIRCEILCSTSTPAEDEGLRREYQMRLLVEGLGQVREADARTWDSILAEWIGMAAIAEASHDALHARLQRCLERRPRELAAAQPVYRDRDRRDARPPRESGEPAGRRGNRGRPGDTARRH